MIWFPEAAINFPYGALPNALQIKPHLKLLAGIWYCAGNGRIRDGFTPEHAYRRWEEAVCLTS